jgi:hypothetical protein
LRQRLAFLLVPCLLLASALALAACGGGDSGDEEKIEETIETSVRTTDPSKCTELMTQTFVEQNTGETGEAAIESCEAEATDTSDDPDSVEITAVKVDGADATAKVAFAGGGFDGQTVEVALVEEEDAWRLDEILGFAVLDNEALAQTLEAQFEAASDEVTAEQISCIGGAIRTAGREQIEELLLSGDSDRFVEFAEACE